VMPFSSAVMAVIPPALRQTVRSLLRPALFVQPQL
jgi:hypothetical protein